MEHLRAQPCGGDARLRFLRDHHGEVSHAVRLCGPGRRYASDRALERDGAPDGRLDRATVPCVCPRRSTATLAHHDRDSIYSAAAHDAVGAMGLTVLKTPVRCPQANAFCERLIGSIRRECLDWLIVLNERHLRFILRAWVVHYNHGRPHASLGPGIPDASPETLARRSGHHIVAGHRVTAAPILAGLHHEYRLDRLAA